MRPSALDPFVDAPDRSALLFDFDGTLSPIVDDPAAAAPTPGVVELLDDLASRYRVVAAVSGRPVSFLRQHLPASVACSGLYGLERDDATGRHVHPEASAWIEPVAAAAAAAARSASASGPADGVTVEAKRLSITLHYRQRPETADAALALAAELAAAHGLEVRTAKMSVELHPPIHASKATAVAEVIGEADRVLFAGDDVGDLPAFDALDELAAAGARVARVVVVTEETDARLLARADLQLAGTGEVPGLLRALVPTPGDEVAPTAP